MNTKALICWIGFCFSANAIGLADFKYTESAKVTGGAMASMLKVMGAFSGEAGKASEGMDSSTYVKGNRLRKEDPSGKVQIVDLDERHIINVDPQNRTYSIITFDEMRTALRQAQEAARINAKMNPKIETKRTGATKVVLSHTAHEVKIRMDLEIESQSSQQGGQTASFWFTSDAWVATDVVGYDEIRKFYDRVGNASDWLPGQMLGASEVSPAMDEFRKSLARMKGFPLVQNASFGASDQTGGGVRLPRSDVLNAGSILDMTIEVTSFSDAPLEDSLFEIPPGYTRVEQGAGDVQG